MRDIAGKDYRVQHVARDALCWIKKGKSFEINCYFTTTKINGLVQQLQITFTSNYGEIELFVSKFCLNFFSEFCLVSIVSFS